jgi:hypothetical protein
MTAKRLKRPRDPVQLGKLIGDILTGQIEDVAAPDPKDEGKNPAAIELGRTGGLKGGRARADSLTPAQRKQIAQTAAKKRWAKGERRLLDFFADEGYYGGLPASPWELSTQRGWRFMTASRRGGPGATHKAIAVGRLMEIQSGAPEIY